jgi:hypothetical protein
LVSDTANPDDGSFNSGNGEVVIAYTVATTASPTTTVPVTTVATATTPGTPALAFTGVNLWPLLASGGGLIVAGVLILSATSTRRRRSC